MNQAVDPALIFIDQDLKSKEEIVAFLADQAQTRMSNNMYKLYLIEKQKFQPLIDDLRYFHFDKVFIGAAGFTLEDQNIYTAEIETAKVKQQAMKQGKKKYLVIDSEKIGMYGFYTMANLKDMDGLITTQHIMSLQDKLILASNLESRK